MHLLVTINVRRLTFVEKHPVVFVRHLLRQAVQ